MQCQPHFSHSLQNKYNLESQIPTEQSILNLKCNVEMVIVGGAVATNYTSATDNLHCHATLLDGILFIGTLFI